MSLQAAGPPENSWFVMLCRSSQSSGHLLDCGVLSELTICPKLTSYQDKS